ncbi:MAG: hypothetical protein IJX91_00215 [Clostridia bacterium]|nr:hypothetical protein [Clostridia bacterium]
MKKKKISLFLAILTAATVFLSGCGEYKPAQSSGNSTDNSFTSSSDGSDSDVDSTDTENQFTVALSLNGKIYKPSIDIYAQWTDGFSYHSAKIDETGVATVENLDGDYRVTLSAVPDGYSYDPSAYMATNNKKNVTIELVKLERSRGEGAGLYSCIPINTTGVYRTTVKSASHVVYYEFTPRESGMYSIESWVDTTQNTVNPLLDVYTGSFAAKYYSKTLDGGAVESTYTKNFIHEVNIRDDEIGNAFTFAVKATSKSNEYPITVDFAVKLDGEMPPRNSTSEMKLPEVTLVHATRPAGEWTTPEILENGHWRYDGTMFGYSDPEEGGDGYYHLYNEATGKYDGATLYAKISQPCQFYDIALTRIEDAGNKNLTIDGVNYKFFLDGWNTFTLIPGYFCVRNIENNVYCPCLSTCGGACLEGCEKCHAECRNVTQELLDSQGGYANFCNIDGAYPVTQELKDFLQAFSVSQLLFMDGNGFVETYSEKQIDAKEADQWLFACGYYK